MLDRAALERNIARLAQFFSIGSCRVRPHFKACTRPPKCAASDRRRIVHRLTCATVGEAETVAEFCDDVLIANEVVSAAKCARIAALQTGSRVTVAVDSVAGLEMAAAARHAGGRIGVLVDVNVGQDCAASRPAPTRCSWLVASC